MRLEILDDKVKPTMKLQLRRDGDSICVLGHDADGNTWHLLTFTENGTVRLSGSVPERLGFQLQGSKIKLES